jgi:hypothetical protein
MARKSIIDIEVNDSQFKAFYDIYSQFEEKIAGLSDESKAAFGAIGAGAGSLEKGIVKTTKAQKGFHQILSESERTMHKMVKSSGELAKNIFGIGKFMMKLTAAGVGFGAAGLWGMDALGRSAVSNQRTARGLSLSQGQTRAFGTDLGRYVPQSMLSNVAGAQADFGKLPYLAMAAGVSLQQAQTMGVDELSIKAAMHAHDVWKSTPPELRTQQVMSSKGFTQIGLSMEDIRRLGNTTASALRAGAAQYRSDTGMLNVSDKSTDAWYKLTRQVTLAGQTIETVLTNKLAQLAPTISDVVNSLTKDFSALIQGITPEEIKKFGDGVKSVAEYLGSKEFLANLKSFGDLIVSILRATGHTVSALSPSTSADRKGFVQSDKIAKAHSDFYFSSILPLKLSPGIKNAPMSEKEAYLSAVEQKYHLSKGLLDSMWLQESSRGKNMLSPAGAMGHFGLMPKTAAAYHTDPNSLRQSGMTAGKIMQENLRHYHGDIQEALAAYNAGQGTVDKAIKASGKGGDWRSSMRQFQSPANYKQTQNYINDVVSRIKTPSVNITIENKTGANLYVSNNAAAH